MSYIGGGSSIPNPGFSGSFNGDINPNGGSVSGEICYTNSDSSMTTCVNGSTDNGGSGGLSFTFRW